MSKINLTRWLVLEWAYRVAERIGILAGDMDPKPETVAIAEREANEWLQSELDASASATQPELF